MLVLTNFLMIMKFVNEFGKAPQRGTSKSVGIDFFMPDASEWTNEQTNKFLSYLTETDQYHYVNEINEINSKNLNLILMYISLDSGAREPFSMWANHETNRVHYSNGSIEVYPGESVCVPSGIRTMFIPGYCGIFFNKSGMGKKGWSVKAQVIDEDYTGYVHVNMVNTSRNTLTVTPGQKLSQLIELPAVYNMPEEINSKEYFEAMSSTERGTGGFGSTGA